MNGHSETTSVGRTTTMNDHSNDFVAHLSEEEADLYRALSLFGMALMELDHSPEALANAALVFSAAAFAAFGESEDFADRSRDLYSVMKANLAEVVEDGSFH